MQWDDIERPHNAGQQPTYQLQAHPQLWSRDVTLIRVHYDTGKGNNLTAWDGKPKLEREKKEITPNKLRMKGTEEEKK